MRESFLMREIQLDYAGSPPGHPHIAQDTYLGYGLAHGLGFTPKGKNRESTSEELHAWYALSHSILLVDLMLTCLH